MTPGIGYLMDAQIDFTAPWHDVEWRPVGDILLWAYSVGATPGSVEQSGVFVGLSSRRSRVQIPSFPPTESPPGFGLGGQVAQSVERRSEKPEVDGSTPSLTTTKRPIDQGRCSVPTSHTCLPGHAQTDAQLLSVQQDVNRRKPHCSFEELSGPAIWIAEVNDGQVAVWEVCDDNPEQRLKLGLIR